MPTYAPADINSKPLPSGQGQAVMYDGILPAIASATATGDLINLMRIPAGTRLGAIYISVTTAFGAAAPVTMHLVPTDGSAATVLVAAGDTVLNTINRKAMVFTPMTTTKDSDLQLLVGAVTTGAAGALSAVALGMANGAA